ncbi:lipopolysaccharide-induced tumor necrosis factor-alpha factor homolog isoform X1 [Syngnathus typhle]|uniref:lipopolysaccharide-induced tumor necrosis factor-alpha factor homolog isoform X1 n=1 Tax=Syngnathus typhle TaxID=161592 RepID=UPI002A6B3D98|nr:lipopolysaccharide-induced tumor necrosis factor-alpha factor homolog isoform X1 [Syngnathus typhle]
MLMDPPVYEVATPPASSVDVERFDLGPPPSYDASILHAPNPPPYQETSKTADHRVSAISRAFSSSTVCPDPFPVLMPIIFSPPQTSPVVTLPTPLDTVVSTSSNLLDSPGSVQCPHCRRDVTTKIQQIPGKKAFTLCCVLAFSRLVCGFCLIPFMITDLWDVHHFCPHCGKQLHVHRKS